METIGSNIYSCGGHTEAYGYDPVGDRLTGTKFSNRDGYLKKHLTHEAAFPIFPQNEVFII
jgi:hypothetical protein